MFGQSGRRPLAWWEFEAPIPYPGYDDEEAALYEAGLLGEQEAAMQVQQWRIAFDRAQAPGFAFCLGHRKPSDMFASWLEGAAAKRAHYRWAGIPRSLLKKWIAERRRSRKTIRELEAATNALPMEPSCHPSG
jgi:hypothetical protein